ncbi:MAG: hypothetical protein IJA10_10750 [Lachnospiraceae bacterium]|nr:hypothetical protein [Lachnospiraceae bacterium]
MGKNYYIEVYNKKWDECLEEAKKENAKDIGETTTYIFEESCNAEEVVGYYLVYHGEDALKDWRTNTEGIKMSVQDLEVDKILTELFK